MSFAKKPDRPRRVATRHNYRESVDEEQRQEEASATHGAASQQIVQYDPSQVLTNSWQSSEYPTIFSTRRPRDFGAGLSSGLKNIAKGVSLGVASLVAAPAFGAHQGGVGGFFKGLGAGVVMAVAFPVAGVSYGITQAARGVINTPEAVMERRAGKKWDKKEREWKENWYSLDEEDIEVKALEVAFEEQKKEINAAADHSGSGPMAAPGTVVDTTYYDLLGVPTDATPAEIRKSYYQLARDCHPDKNLNDPNAHEQFQQLGEAYQVLGDEKRRSEYNKYGKDAAKGMPIIDSNLFFTMLFGSEALQPYVGMLKLAMFVETFEDQDVDGNITEAIMEFQQRKREVSLAVQLRDRIAGFVNANESERIAWKNQMTTEAKNLCSRNFGDAMIEAVGWVYENYSLQFLGKLDTFLGLGGRYAKLQAKNRNISNFCRAAGMAVKASIAARKLEKSQERKEKAESVRAEKNEAEGEEEFIPASPEEEKARLENAKQLEEALPLILETVLNVCLFDVEATVRQACKKVLKDLATPIEIRRQRAEALIELGQIFQREAEQYKIKKKDEKVDVIRQMEEAYIRAAQEKDDTGESRAGDL